MNWILISIYLAAVFISWWLSGFDSGLSGQAQHRGADFTRRFIRCLISFALITGGVLANLLGNSGRVIQLAVAMLIALTWAGCVTELFARGFVQLIDSDDSREFDPKAIERELDRLAALVQTGQIQEAVQLCGHLQESGDASTLAMEAMLFRLYDQMYADERLAERPDLAAAWRLRRDGRFDEAEANLKQLLEPMPTNLAAVLLLVQIYCRDAMYPLNAEALLKSLRGRPDVLPGFIAFAFRRCQDWSKVRPGKGQSVEGIESLLVRTVPPPIPGELEEAETVSVDELLAGGRLATAIELLEAELKTQPANFELWMKLAEAHGRHCLDVIRAERIVRQIELNPAFNPEQIRQARAKLREWRAATGG